MDKFTSIMKERTETIEYGPRALKAYPKARINASDKHYYHFVATLLEQDGSKLGRSIAWPVGYCIKHNCQHATPEEASACYAKYIHTEKNGELPSGFHLVGEGGVLLFTHTRNY